VSGGAHAAGPPRPDTGTRLADERTFLAHERTQIAWVRTALSLISFGFGIAKFFQYLHAQDNQPAPALGPFTVGMLMITVALVGLLVANLQHRRAMSALHRDCPELPPSAAGAMAVLIMLLGVVAFAGALIRH
jgi:putative membrane protein